MQYPSGGSRVSQTGGANLKGGGGADLLFGQICPENRMKMKEIGPRGRGRVSLEPSLDPPMYQLNF